MSERTRDISCYYGLIAIYREIATVAENRVNAIYREPNRGMPLRRRQPMSCSSARAPAVSAAMR